MSRFAEHHNVLSSADLPADSALTGLVPVLDARRVHAYLAEHLPEDCKLVPLQISYVRYKPQTNCLVAYIPEELEEGELCNFYVFGKAYSTNDFDRAAQKLSTHHWDAMEGFPPYLLVPEWKTILFLYPNDPALPGLRQLVHRKKIQRLLYTHTDFGADQWRISDKKMRFGIVRYKPEKRAVVRISSRATSLATGERVKFQVYARYYSDKRAAGVFKIMNRLWEETSANETWKTPRILAYLPEKELILVQAAPGLELLDAWREGEDNRELQRLGIALAGLHEASTADLTVRSNEALVDDALSTAQTLRTILPEEADRLARIEAYLRSNQPTTPQTPEFVHADFHQGQALFSTELLTLLDFDRTYAGDSSIDIGNFVAHLIQMEHDGRIDDALIRTREFIDAYETARGSQLDQASVKYWTLWGMFQVSPQPFRCLKSNWKEQIKAWLRRCEEQCECS